MSGDYGKDPAQFVRVQKTKIVLIVVLLGLAWVLR